MPINWMRLKRWAREYKDYRYCLGEVRRGEEGIISKLVNLGWSTALNPRLASVRGLKSCVYIEMAERYGRYPMWRAHLWGNKDVNGHAREIVSQHCTSFDLWQHFNVWSAREMRYAVLTSRQGLVIDHNTARKMANGITPQECLALLGKDGIVWDYQTPDVMVVGALQNGGVARWRDFVQLNMGLRGGLEWIIKHDPGHLNACLAVFLAHGERRERMWAMGLLSREARSEDRK